MRALNNDDIGRGADAAQVIVMKRVMGWPGAERRTAIGVGASREGRAPVVAPSTLLCAWKEDARGRFGMKGDGGVPLWTGWT